MIVLSLKSLGQALSSRSKARALAETVTTDIEKIQIDFSEIRACNQSFVNELLLVLLLEKKIKTDNIRTSGFNSSNVHIEHRFKKELEFFQKQLLPS